jgi:chemotaxis methyl-accepting protein methylase
MMPKAAANAAWAWLQENVLPAMIRANPPGNALRAWVAGCSSGEEAYSLAIAFQEVAEFSLQMPGIAALFAVVAAIAIWQPGRSD